MSGTGNATGGQGPGPQRRSFVGAMYKRFSSSGMPTNVEEAKVRQAEIYNELQDLQRSEVQSSGARSSVTPAPVTPKKLSEKIAVLQKERKALEAKFKLDPYTPPETDEEIKKKRITTFFQQEQGIIDQYKSQRERVYSSLDKEIFDITQITSLLKNIDQIIKFYQDHSHLIPEDALTTNLEILDGDKAALTSELEIAKALANNPVLVGMQSSNNVVAMKTAEITAQSISMYAHTSLRSHPVQQATYQRIIMLMSNLIDVESEVNLNYKRALTAHLLEPENAEKFIAFTKACDALQATLKELRKILVAINSEVQIIPNNGSILPRDPDAGKFIYATSRLDPNTRKFIYQKIDPNTSYYGMLYIINASPEHRMTTRVPDSSIAAQDFIAEMVETINAEKERAKKRTDQANSASETPARARSDSQLSTQSVPEGGKFGRRSSTSKLKS